VIAQAERKKLLESAFREVLETSPQTRILHADDAAAMVPFLRPGYTAAAFYDPANWDMEVDSLLQGYLRQARHDGAEIRTNTPVTAISRDGSRFRLTTPTGEIHAQVIVNAAGAWADGLAQMAGLAPLGIIPHRRTAITVDVPAKYNLAVTPGVAEVAEDYYFKPESGRLMVSPADATPSDPCDAQPEDLDVAYAAHFLEQSTILPVRTIAHKWAGLRSFAPDKRQVVGFDPRDPAFFWLAGQGGSGILTSPALSAWAAGVFLHGRPPQDLMALGLAADYFSPEPAVKLDAPAYHDQGHSIGLHSREFNKRPAIFAKQNILHCHYNVSDFPTWDMSFDMPHWDRVWCEPSACSKEATSYRAACWIEFLMWWIAWRRVWQRLWGSAY
jgi:D-arginine dehydrogenase